MFQITPRSLGFTGLVAAGAILFSTAIPARAADWPKGHELAEAGTSPDGHYGILIPGADAPARPDDAEATNFLVDVKAQQVLGKIAKSNYEKDGRRMGLHVDWSPDSKICVVLYEARFGYHSVSALLPAGGKFQQYDLGTKVAQALGRAMNGKKDEEAGVPEFLSRFGGGTKILVRGAANDDPKQMRERSESAFFTGIFDAATGTWSKTAAHQVDQATYDSFAEGYGPLQTDWKDFDAQSKAENLDRFLNAVYRVLKANLPAEKFAAVKKEQVAWLKERDALKDPERQSAFVIARIKALKELAWQE